MPLRLQPRRFCYVSPAIGALSETDLREIWGRAEVLHRRMDLSGVLAYTGRHFFQVIEGPAESVEALLQQIRADTRLGPLHVLCDEQVPVRRFDRWQGTTVDSLDLIDDVALLAESQTAGSEEAEALTDRLLRVQAPDTQL